MIVPEADLTLTLRQMNPWWRKSPISDLPPWRRAAFYELETWVRKPPVPRAVMLSGARQIGKTTLFQQVIQSLVESGVPPQNILYATFDHPLLKLAGLQEVLRLWRSCEAKAEGPEYLFLDEIQFLKDWQTWVKHQVDFEKNRRIAITGSATPLVMEGQESGVGRWHTIKLATLSFYEYLQIRGIKDPSLPDSPSFLQFFEWSANKFSEYTYTGDSLAAHFHEYILRGGFPQSALATSINLAQKLLREDIVDKILKRDMTALFGVRRIFELEQTFLYLCLHDGSLLDVPDLCKNLQSIKKPTVLNFISLLEAAHLIYKLPPHGYGKEILRGKHKIYMADPAIGPSVLLKGKSLLEDDERLGRAVETAFFKHAFTRYYGVNVGFSYWCGKKGHEVDLIADIEGRLVPFEVKYRSSNTDAGELKGLIEFCKAKKVSRAYCITRRLTDFSVLEAGDGIKIAKIPAPLACYWLGKGELQNRSDRLEE